MTDIEQAISVEENKWVELDATLSKIQNRFNELIASGDKDFIGADAEKYMKIQTSRIDEKLAHVKTVITALRAQAEDEKKLEYVKRRCNETIAILDTKEQTASYARQKAWDEGCTSEASRRGTEISIIEEAVKSYKHVLILLKDEK